MSGVDNRVVHMTFDNKQFERDIQKTIDSITRLKESLDFSKVKKGFSDLDGLSKVKMNVDTTAFTNGISDAISQVKKLQDNMNFGAAHKSFNQLTDAAKGFNLNNMGSAIAGVSTKFLGLATVAITTLATITSHAVRAGIDMATALSTDPIIGGFREMETNMNSIQTILANTASKGSTLDDVNEALRQLNEYSDQTIYNFSQMAKNIGTFTAAGVDLDTSVNAIKGIANLAAISGSSSEQASSAMYQLSQALATGTLKLIDWNSVVNAGMGGEVFKNALFETGKALGTIADVPIDKSLKEWEDSGNNFRDSLQDGWITSEVLTTTLQAFTGDLTEAQLLSLGYTKEQAAEMVKLGALGKAAATEVKTLTQLLSTVKESIGSGWSQSFQIIFGNFEEAKKTFTDFSEAIGETVKKSAEQRNKLLEGWKLLGGRTKLIEGIKDAFAVLQRVMETISAAFHEFFPATTAQRLFDITKSFHEFFENLRKDNAFFIHLQTIFEGFFAAIDIGIEIVKGIIGVFQDLFDHFAGGSGDGVVDFFDRVSFGIQSLHDALVEGGGLDKFFENVTEKIIGFVEALKDPGAVLDAIKGAFSDFFGGIDFGTLDGLDEAFQRILDKISELVENLDFKFDIPDGLVNFFKQLAGDVDENTTNSVNLAGGFDRITDALSRMWSVTEKVWDGIQKIGDAFGWVFDKLWALKDIVFEVLGSMWDFVKKIGPWMQKGLMSDEFDQILDTLDTIGVLLGGKGLAQIGSKGLGINAAVDLTGGNLPKFGGVLDGMAGTFQAFKTNLDTLTGTLKTMQTQIRANALLDIAKALALLTASVVVLSFINPESLAKSLTALAVGMGQLVGALALLNASSGKLGFGTGLGLASLGATLILIATGVLVLSAAVRVLAGLDWNELAKGLTGTLTLMGIMVGSAKLLSGSSGSLVLAGIGMIAIATALTILAGAMKIFATMSWEELGKGMAAVAGGLLLIAGAVNLMPASIILIGPGLIAVATSMSILAGAMLIFATMSWEEIGKGLAAIGGGLVLIAGALQLMPASSIITGPALIAVATALVIMGGALKEFATLSWEEIGKAMTVLGGSLLILGAGLTFMSGTIGGAIALGIVSVSLMLLQKALKGFADMKWKDLGKGLGVMAIALASIAAAALLMQPAVGAILALSVALLALGAGFALLGVGAALLAEAFQIIAAAGTAGIDVIMYAIDQLVVRIPDLIEIFTEGLIQILQSILDALPALIEATGKIIEALLKVIIDAIPDVGKAIGLFVLEILEVIKDTFPELVETGVAMLVALLTGIRDNIKEVTKLAVQIILGFIDGIASEIPAIVDTAFDLIYAFTSEIVKRIDDVAAAGLEIIVALAKGIIDNVSEIVNAVGEIVVTFIEEVGESASEIAEAGMQVIVDFVSRMGENANLLVTQGTLALISFLSGIANNLILLANAAAEVLIEFMHGLADAIDTHDDEFNEAAEDLIWALVEGLVTAVGAKKVVDKLWDIGWDMASGIIGGALKKFGISSPSRVFFEMGQDVIDGLVTGLDDSGMATRSATNLATTTTDAFRKAIADTALSLQVQDEFNPKITPVLDLTNVRASAGELNGLLGTQPFTAGVSVEAAQLLASETARTQTDVEPARPVETTEISFTQINNSPQPLSTARIYKNTNSQIERAKRVLENV